MPLSALGVNWKEEINGILDTMGKKFASSFIPNPPPRQESWYEPEEDSFAAPFGGPSRFGLVVDCPEIGDGEGFCFDPSPAPAFALGFSGYVMQCLDLDGLVGWGPF